MVRITLYRMRKVVWILSIGILFQSQISFAQEENPYWYIDPEGKKVTFTPVDSIILLNFEVVTPDSTKISSKTGLPEKKVAGTPEKRAETLKGLRKLGYELREISSSSPVKLPPFAFEDSIQNEIVPLFRVAGFQQPSQPLATAKILEKFASLENEKLGEKIVADVLPAYRRDSDGQIVFFRPNTVLIKIRGYMKRDSINLFFERESLEVLTQKWQYPEYYQARLYTCKLPAGRPFFASLQELAKQPEVRFAIPRKLIGGLSEILPYTKGDGIWEEDPPFIKKLDTDVRDFYRAFVTEDPEIILRRWNIYFNSKAKPELSEKPSLAAVPESLRVAVGFSGSYSAFSEELQKLGIRVSNDSVLRRIESKVPIRQISLTLSIFQIIKFAEWPQVTGIGLPPELSEFGASQKVNSGEIKKADPITSEGVFLIEADKFHNLGVRGQKTKVGILDGGFLGADVASSVGELPVIETSHRFPTDPSFFSGSDHGTSVAEVLYDVARSTEFYFYKLPDALPASLIDALEWFKQREVRIISISIGWFMGSPQFNPIGDPADGTGEIDEVFNFYLNSDPKLSVFAASGNFPQRHHEKTYTAFGRTGFAEEFGSLGFPETTDVYHNFTHLDDDASIGILQSSLSGLGNRFITFLTWRDQNTINPRYWDFDLLLLQGLNDDSINTSIYNPVGNPGGAQVASSSTIQPPSVLMSDSFYRFYNWERINFDFNNAKPFPGSSPCSFQPHDFFHLVVRNTLGLIPPPNPPYNPLNPPFLLELYTDKFSFVPSFACNSSGWVENSFTKVYTDPENITMPGGSIVTPPADNLLVCTVGAFVANSGTREGNSGGISSISSRGPTNEVSPLSIVRDGPDFVAPTVVSTFTSSPFGGTSAATPHAAGAAALLRAVDTNLTRFNIFQILCNSAEFIPGIDFETQGCGKLKMPPLSLRGDMNQDGAFSPTDIVSLLIFVFEGPFPPPFDSRIADVNCDGMPTPSDLVILLSFTFLNEPIPCPLEPFLQLVGSKPRTYGYEMAKRKEAQKVKAEVK